MPDRIAPSPVDVPMYSDNELREACRKATARERQRIREAITDYAAEMGYGADEVWGVAFPHMADFLHDLLDGDGQ